jgi:hypothetical protein
VSPAWIAALVLGVATAGCSSDEDSPDAAGGASGSTTATSAGSGGTGGDPTPPESCVQKDEVGNSQGVGDYCTPGGSECGETTGAPLCLATAAADEKQWMCSRLCSSDADCGEDAICFDCQACVLLKCFDEPVAGCNEGGAGGTGSGGSSGGGMGGAGGG